MAFAIIAESRANNTAAEVREAGKIPAIMYGPDTNPVSVSIGYTEFIKLYNEAGESSLIDFSVAGNGAPTKVLIQDVQLDPVKGTVIHVDFRQINMKEEMTANTELNFIGEAPAVKALGGTLIKGLETLEIKCLPNNLVSEIDVDLSVLHTFDDVIEVKDLTIPAGITVLDEPTAVVAKVQAALTEEQIKAMEESGPKDVADVEVEEKGKKEDEESADEK